MILKWPPLMQKRFSWKCTIMIIWINVRTCVTSRYLRHGYVITSQRILYDVITYPCHRYLFAACKASYMWLLPPTHDMHGIIIWSINLLCVTLFCRKIIYILMLFLDTLRQKLLKSCLIHITKHLLYTVNVMANDALVITYVIDLLWLSICSCRTKRVKRSCFPVQNMQHRCCCIP